MKVRFYPKADTVKKIILASIAQQEGLIRDCETKLGQLTNSSLYLPGEPSWGEQKMKAIERKTVLEERLELLNSHDPPDVAAEIEL
jgi:hypothetical protein